MRYLIVLEPTSTGFSAYSPDLEGCVAAGGDREETIALMREAVAFHLEGLAGSGEPIPGPSSESAYVEVPVRQRAAGLPSFPVGGTTLGDIDKNIIENLSIKYTGLCRRYWRHSDGMIAFLMLQGLSIPLIALGSLSILVVIVMLTLGVLLCGVVALFTWSSLTRFRCPRCGGRFTLPPTSHWPAGTCKHCGLRLGWSP